MVGRFILTLMIAFVSLTPSFGQGVDNPEPQEWKSCSACHSIGEGVVVGPDLEGVNERRDKEWLKSFIRSSQNMIKNGDSAAVALFEEYNEAIMPDNDLSDEQTDKILTFIKNYDPSAVQSEAAQPVSSYPTRGDFDNIGPGSSVIPFYLSVFLLLLFIADLAFTRFIKWKAVHISGIIITFGIIVSITYIEAKALGRQHGYSPDQPVWFSHKVHSGQNNIDCLYCHSSATESKHAGIPGTDVCLNCHNVVREGALTGRTEIDKIHRSKQTGKPLEWVQVHNLPDHVYFNHAQHVNVAGLDDCTDCHGTVEEMDRITQVEDLSMGWCLECHRTNEVNFEDNPYYKETYKEFHQEFIKGEKEIVTVEDVGGYDCSACHY